MAKLFRVIDEHTWLSCTVPRHMLRYMKDRTTDRKLRLWACAATAHRYAQSESVLAVVALVETWADGKYPSELKSHPGDGICSQSAWEAAYEGTLRTLEKLPTSDKKNQYTQFQRASLAVTSWLRAPRRSGRSEARSRFFSGVPHREFCVRRTVQFLV